MFMPYKGMATGDGPFSDNNIYNYSYSKRAGVNMDVTKDIASTPGHDLSVLLISVTFFFRNFKGYFAKMNYYVLICHHH